MPNDRQPKKSSKTRPTTKAGREAARVRKLAEPEEVACSEKEFAFIDEWMLDFNGTRAMLRAGITTKSDVARVYASNYLDRPHVLLEIASRRKRSADRLSDARERMIEELQRVGLANIEDVMEWGSDGLVVKSSSALSAEQSAAIAEICETRGPRGRTIRVKLHPKIEAISQFLKQISPSAHEQRLGQTRDTGSTTIIIEGGPTGLEVSVGEYQPRP